jgi:hypothetical protein
MAILLVEPMAEKRDLIKADLMAFLLAVMKEQLRVGSTDDY